MPVQYRDIFMEKTGDPLIFASSVLGGKGKTLFFTTLAILCGSSAIRYFNHFSLISLHIYGN